jgi:hypothetical protein
MYQNFELENIPATENIVLDGELMLLKTHDYIPQALSAVAKLMRRAGHFVCHFEVSSKAEFFVAEVSASESHQCFRLAEKKMRRQIAQWKLAH